MEPKNIIVIIDKSCINENLLSETISKWFPEPYYINVGIFSRDKFRNKGLNIILPHLQSPILIGYGYGAVYLEHIKNYSYKYLISPFWNNGIRDSMFYDLSDYDKENTYCLFGGDSKSKEMAKIYSKHYPKTFNELVEGKLNIIDGIEICGILNLFSLEGKKFKQ